MQLYQPEEALFAKQMASQALHAVVCAKGWRNAEIFRRAIDGEAIKEIAADYRLSVTRVHDIIDDARRVSRRLPEYEQPAIEKAAERRRKREAAEFRRRVEEEIRAEKEKHEREWMRLHSPTNLADLEHAVAACRDTKAAIGRSTQQVREGKTRTAFLHRVFDGGGPFFSESGFSSDKLTR